MLPAIHEQGVSPFIVAISQSTGIVIDEFGLATYVGASIGVTIPSGFASMDIRLHGGGGGGGGEHRGGGFTNPNRWCSAGGGSGGGAGEYVERLGIPITPDLVGMDLTGILGAGGARRTTRNGNGFAGTATTINNLNAIVGVSALGGRGGNVGSRNLNVFSAGATPVGTDGVDANGWTHVRGAQGARGGWGHYQNPRIENAAAGVGPASGTHSGYTAGGGGGGGGAAAWRDNFGFPRDSQRRAGGIGGNASGLGWGTAGGTDSLSNGGNGASANPTLALPVFRGSGGGGAGGADTTGNRGIGGNGGHGAGGGGAGPNAEVFQNGPDGYSGAGGGGWVTVVFNP